MKSKTLLWLLMLLTPSLAIAEAPIISSISDVTSSKPANLIVTPSLSNSSTAGIVNWTKAYGPDDVTVSPSTGAILWSIPSSMPSESFHIGIKAANKDGYDIENFIVHAGVPKVVLVGPAEKYTNFNTAFVAETVSGTTFVLRNGSYTGENYSIAFTARGSLQIPKDGSANAYTTIMAEDPGQVTLTNAVIDINGVLGDRSYYAIKGFFVKGGSIGATGYLGGTCTLSSCRPHHIKFIGNGVESAGDIPFNAFRSDYILFENNYAFGGGRYKIASYQASKIVMRRNVARFDRSNNEMAEPKGTYSTYTTMDASVANNLAIDADNMNFTTLGQLAGEFTCPTTSGDSRVKFDRNIQLNSVFPYGNIDSQGSSPPNHTSCDAEVNDVVSWDIRPSSVYVITRSGSLFNHATMGNIVGQGTVPQFFNGWPSAQARGITNSVLHNFQNGDMFYGLKKGPTEVTVAGKILERFGVDTVNITNIGGNLTVCCTDVATSSITANQPLYSSTNSSGGLRYLLRAEAGSNLSGKAKDGGALGATVMTFKGKSGTLWGETGYNDETSIPMWPFPLEDVIKEKFAQYSFNGDIYQGSEFERVKSGTGTIKGARGFAVSGRSLTNYVWGYLGNTVPPFEVTATAGDKSAFIRWNPHPSSHQNTITDYKIYNFNPVSGAMTNPRTVGGTVFEYLIEGLVNGVNSHFAVTAVDSVKGESSYSYSVSVVPAIKPKPLPPTLSAD